MAILMFLLRIFLIPILTILSLSFINRFVHRSFSWRKSCLLFILLTFIINIITLYATSYLFLNSYIKSISFYYNKLFDIHNNITAFSIKWIGLSIIVGIVIVTFYCLWLFFTQRNTNQTLKVKNLILSVLLSSLTLLIILGFAWANRRFPLSDASVVVFTLNMPLQGAVLTSLYSFSCEVLLPLFIIIAVIIIVLLAIRYTMKEISQNNFHRIIHILSKTVIIHSIILLIGVLLLIAKQLPIKGYIKAQQTLQNPQSPPFSEFYDKYFVNPQNIQISMPEQKRNLIIILLESMEIGFADKHHGGQMSYNLIPELTDLTNQYINFSSTENLGGGLTLAGTNGTMPAIISKFNGVPYNSQTVKLTQDGRKVLPNYCGLFDILKQNGYSMQYLFGSDKAFAARGEYLEQHGVTVRDLHYYKKQKKLPKNYFVGNWGFEDEKLYHFAKEELSELAKSDQPFMLGLLTVDTHFPEGYLCKQCGNTYHKKGQSKFYDIVSCASKQAAAFVKWIQTQDWYNNTTIVIMGDHPFGNETMLQNADINQRYWIDIFINSTIETKITHRQFSSFDMFPTILESIGTVIEGHRLGFGTSLFADEPTLIEQIGDIAYLNQVLLKPAQQYEAHQE